ncbi:hypothetical protein I3842_16G084200 [Carya illinoinensis]|uniref:Uncharacterized protein n=1 Tax=Carya illinoinensis TaxID=32201 RepID=A0A922A0Y3_CARIL|nr:hypothetical protein I3842_16G084200 [Carya illinoinensis]
MTVFEAHVLIDVNTCIFPVRIKEEARELGTIIEVISKILRCDAQRRGTTCCVGDKENAQGSSIKKRHLGLADTAKLSRPHIQDPPGITILQVANLL